MAVWPDGARLWPAGRPGGLSTAGAQQDPRLRTAWLDGNVLLYLVGPTSWGGPAFRGLLPPPLSPAGQRGRVSRGHRDALRQSQGGSMGTVLLLGEAARGGRRREATRTFWGGRPQGSVGAGPALLDTWIQALSQWSLDRLTVLEHRARGACSLHVWSGQGLRPPRGREKEGPPVLLRQAESSVPRGLVGGALFFSRGRLPVSLCRLKAGPSGRCSLWAGAVSRACAVGACPAALASPGFCPHRKGPAPHVSSLGRTPTGLR